MIVKRLCFRRLIARNFSGRVVSEPESKSTNYADHCYKTLFPWTTIDEFSQSIASSTFYNKDGLIAINKPFGVRIYRTERSEEKIFLRRRFLLPNVHECDFALEDSLPYLKEHHKVSELKILKSAERYGSGIVLLSAKEAITNSVINSINRAKHNKVPHLTHWMITLGCPVVSYEKERVGIQFLELENYEEKQPVILTDFSRNSVKAKEVYPVLVEYKLKALNEALGTSLIEVSSSSVRHHFLRVYAATRVASILGDFMYSNRMNTLLGVPIKLNIEHAAAFDMQPLPLDMARVLDVRKGVLGHSTIPTMLHLKSILLPSFKRKEDLLIDCPLPQHFQWTAQQLKLLQAT